MAIPLKRALAWMLLVLLVLATPLRFMLVAFVLGWLVFILVRWLISLYA